MGGRPDRLLRALRLNAALRREVAWMREQLAALQKNTNSDREALPPPR